MKKFILIFLIMNKVAFATLDTLEIYNFPGNPFKKVEIFLSNNDPIVHEFGQFKTFDPQVIKIPTPTDLTQEKIGRHSIKSFFHFKSRKIKERRNIVEEVKLTKTECNQNYIINYVLYRDDLKQFDTVITKFFLKERYFSDDCKLKLKIIFNKEKIIEELEIFKK